MREIFLTVLEMSITASVVIPVVMLVRFLIRKAPRRYSYLLWIIAGFRLICPFSFESRLSIFNLFEAKEVTATAVPEVTAQINGAVQAVQLPANAVNTVNTVSTVSAPAVTAAPESFDIVGLLGIIWLCGIAAMVIYGVVSYILICRSVRTAVHDEGNIYFTESRNAPFILGFAVPKIYIPYDIDGDSRSYVIAHERYHIKRKDHIVKLISYLILSLHWFNPLCWLSFMMMSKDIELSCDEKVLSQGAELKEYSKLLVSLAVKKNFPTPSPLAFGEVGVKHRVKNILKWKRPTVWITLIALIICTCVVTVCVSNANNGDDEKGKDNKEKDEKKSTETAETKNIYGYDSDRFVYESEFDASVDISVASTEPEPESESVEAVEPETEMIPETTTEAVEITEPKYEPEPSYQTESETDYSYLDDMSFTIKLPPIETFYYNDTSVITYSYEHGNDFKVPKVTTFDPFPVIGWDYEAIRRGH